MLLSVSHKYTRRSALAVLAIVLGLT
jgi:hypothetical protein